ncbi:Ubiquinone biosynthesis protein COQ4-like, mitochondrial [Porphyridium purpureum]|uniref:Ubiquinone biosynthesis protein COQ4 homolog, mitochondrial n=1 Tax=Porphyridium purpureum TaxID=35688 RepID=A0A5J4Z4E9_PORPP|nr:Ubiquinone biosynthesis protein COQ4-like, mitochondrial [Porphyridium purpureum]|eukprot:POR0882..scf295_1
MHGCALRTRDGRRGGAQQASCFSAMPPPPLPRLSVLGRMSLAVGSAVVSFADPRRADLVAALGETTGAPALRALRERMSRSPAGRRVLQERYMFKDDVQKRLPQLLELPSSTFGHCYAKWMRAYGFRADERPDVRFVDDPELAYIMLRYRECHDFWHTLTALRPTVLGELGQKWMEAVHTRLPVATLSALASPAMVSSRNRKVLLSELVPWAVRCGSTCEDLLSVEYEKCFEVDIVELRTRLNVITPRSYLSDTKVLNPDCLP